MAIACNRQDGIQAHIADLNLDVQRTTACLPQALKMLNMTVPGLLQSINSLYNLDGYVNRDEM